MSAGAEKDHVGQQGSVPLHLASLHLGGLWLWIYLLNPPQDCQAPGLSDFLGLGIFYYKPLFTTVTGWGG